MNALLTSQVADAMLREHGELDRLTGRLRRMMSEEALDRCALEAALACVERTLLRHFDLEEGDGYFAHVLEAAPHTHRQVFQLLSEHRWLRQELRRLRGLVNTRFDQEALRAAVVGWLVRLDDHERRENALAQEAFQTDLGTGD